MTIQSLSWELCPFMRHVNCIIMQGSEPVVSFFKYCVVKPPPFPHIASLLCTWENKVFSRLVKIRTKVQWSQHRDFGHVCETDLLSF